MHEKPGIAPFAQDESFLHDGRKGDEVHLIYVIPRKHLNTNIGAPPVDYLPREGPPSAEQQVGSTHHFIESRFTRKLEAHDAAFVIHVEKVQYSISWLEFSSLLP